MSKSTTQAKSSATFKGTDNDLPLMSNTSQALVRHYVLDLECDLIAKIFKGSITLFLDVSIGELDNKQVFSIQEFQLPNNPERSSDDVADPPTSATEQPSGDFKLILDCCDIDVDTVHRLPASKETLDWLFGRPLSDATSSEFHELSLQSGSPLNHCTDKWALYISDPASTKPGDFPSIVKVYYRTRPEGASLRWVKDQDGNPCVYTAGMWINNRSLLPCQEYGSLSTWQAAITVAPPARVLMSGDEMEKITQMEDGLVKHHVRSRMPLPSFAVALCVGHWQCEEISDGSFPGDASEDNEAKNQRICAPGDESTAFSFLSKTCLHDNPCDIPFSTTPVLPCRVFAPSSIIAQAVQEFQPTFWKYCEAVQRILGPCPFRRMDIIIYPPSCQDMAMCNPNLLFISQSTMAGDHSMCIRLGHELSHYWFGLLIGARDWTEEWLSEGFATYVEDLVQAKVMNWDEDEAKMHLELSAYLRYRTLQSEVAHTQPELQTLRPNQDAGLETSRNGDPESTMFIKDGINPYKMFSQVHYLKGYFLLRWLGHQVGVTKFTDVFRQYIVEHHGRMVTSKDFLALVFKSFTSLTLNGYTVDSVCRIWLDSTELPRDLEASFSIDENSLFSEASKEVERWSKLDVQNKRMRSAAKRPKRIQKQDFVDLNHHQLIVLLDGLLQKKTLSSTTLSQLNRHYSLDKQNPEIQHRWFELVVKHLYSPAFKDLGAFLERHRAMGVYLFGEMVIARCPRLLTLAKQTYEKIQDDMEATTRKIVRNMLFGSDA